jgi:uncharacterized protein YggE
MPTSKVLLKKRAAALKLKLKKAADAHEQARLEAFQHAQEAEELEAAFEGLVEHEHVLSKLEPPPPQMPLPCLDASR